MGLFYKSNHIILQIQSNYFIVLVVVCIADNIATIKQGVLLILVAIKYFSTHISLLL